MKKSARAGTAACLAAIVLSGCAAMGENDPSAESLREKYQQMETVTARANVSFTAEDTDFSFKLGYDKTGTTEWITVIEPEAVAGVTAVFEGNTELLPADGIFLASGTDLAGDLSPAKTLPGLWRVLTGDIPSEEGTETLDGIRTVALTYEEQAKESKLSRKIWIDRETKTPLRAEISVDGRRVIVCDFLSFEYT